MKKKLWESRAAANFGHAHVRAERQDVSRITFDHSHCLATDNLTATFFIEICSSLDAITLVLSTVFHEAVAIEKEQDLISYFPNNWHRYVGD